MLVCFRSHCSGFARIPISRKVRWMGNSSFARVMDMLREPQKWPRERRACRRQALELDIWKDFEDYRSG
jgi:hypothetical protein